MEYMSVLNSATLLETNYWEVVSFALFRFAILTIYM